MALINKNAIRAILGASALALAGMVAAPAIAATPDGKSVIRTYCLACHTEDGASGTFSRISELRKTPEGWHMTLNRMEHLRGLQLPADEKRVLIKYLADHQGLAPVEAAPYRYLLEQDTNRVEEIDEAYVEMCARCHSGARFGLQRRSEAEWNLLVHFHMGQNPTLELHALSRDRPWMHLAMTETVPKLAQDYPLATEAWRDWQQAAKPDLSGPWRVLGHVPGKGDFDARMTAVAAADQFTVQLEGHYLDGTPIRGDGTATVYTGYEWRAALNVDGVQMRQVMAAADQGQEMSGRMFMRNAREIGGELRAFKEGATGQVIAVMPSHLRIGAPAQTVTVVGSHLTGQVSLGDGVRVVEVLSSTPDRITVRAQASGAPGMRDVVVGRSTGAGLLAVYDRVARIEVMPANAVARIGGPGDAQVEKVRVAYRAVAYAVGPEGQDDLRLGYMDATWATEPFDEAAAETQDHVFAGSFDRHGVFTPADAGPNPNRTMSANNVGNLSVVATVDDGVDTVQGQAHLLVAVPDFVRRVLD